VPEDAEWLRAFAEALPAPVLTTAKARGLLTEAHPLALGVVAGREQEDLLLGLADLIVALGVDPEELAAHLWRSSAAVIQFSRTVRSGYPFTPLVEVLGDLALILEELAPRLRGKTQVDWDVSQLHRLKKAQRG